MKITRDFLKDERGFATLEFSFTFFILMIMIMSIYDVLKFQNDMGMVYFNEQAAKHRVDLVLLNGKSDEIVKNFEAELDKSGRNTFFRSLRYFDVTLRCYNSLSLDYAVTCGKTSKLLRVNYKVRRKFTDNYISALLNIPVEFEREVFIVNDYYN